MIVLSRMENQRAFCNFGHIDVDRTDDLTSIQLARGSRLVPKVQKNANVSPEAKWHFSEVGKIE